MEVHNELLVRLEQALLRFIEKETEEPTTESSIKIIPDAARVLIELWRMMEEN